MGCAVQVARPFIKMAGGKTKLLPELRRHVPGAFKRYYEPFLGGGALFFDLCAQRGEAVHATLSDANSTLVETYKEVRDHVGAVMTVLAAYADAYRQHGERFYYDIRKATPTDPTVIAARMIFLNKTCFNGLWRVNKKGAFNVPHGAYINPTICDEENLRACSAALKNADIQHNHFACALATAKATSFVYCDPPYWPVSATADFIAYTKDPFGPTEQELLRDTARKLHRQGTTILLSNADVPPVRALYRGFHVRRIEAARAINSKGSARGKVGELLIW